MIQHQNIDFKVQAQQQCRTIRIEYPVICKVVIFMLVSLFIQDLQAQPQKPPSPIKVTTYQNLSFGSIILGSIGGKVKIDERGIRSVVMGDIILPAVGNPGNESIFEVKAPPGTLITILIDNAVLTSGSHSMSLTLGPTDPISPFVIPKNPSPLPVHVGGTLTIGNMNQNPSGNYSGIFTVTFIQQ